ncbi:hypothetical protein [Mesorhizobium salmacidum]|uniref:ImmA/IrrE family metallo-endopeptidase n=1 Tax=Mesorhizobium salmacidum TaxID=3015171 RepID=A0ABU8L213_9HYPH
MRNVIAMTSGSLGIDFALTENTDVQAIAVFSSPPKILMTFGLADAMCRLSSVLVTAGMFVSFGDTDPTWSPKLQNTVITVEDQIRDEPFRWHPEYTPWMNDGERQVIFAYLLVSMSRFIVLHEIGHIGYAHSHGPSGTSPRLAALIDGQATNEADRRAAIISQAKEIAADGFAFNTHLCLQAHELGVADLDPMRKLLTEKLIGTPRLRLRWTLLSAYFVFQLLDRRNWNLETATLATHPPAPFRLKCLYAAALELKHPDLPESEIIEEVSGARTFGSAVFDVGLKRFPDLFWIDQVADEAFDAIFMEIYAELHNWTVWGGKKP